MTAVLPQRQIAREQCCRDHKGECGSDPYPGMNDTAIRKRNRRKYGGCVKQQHRRSRRQFGGDALANILARCDS